MLIEFATTRAKDVAAKWKYTYLRKDGWYETFKGSSEQTYAELLAAPDDPDKLAQIIGNKSWTYLICDGCREEVKIAVVFEINDRSARLCRTCLKAASVAIEAVIGGVGE